MIPIEMITEHYSANRKKLVNSLKKFAKSVQNAEDIVQDAYERALKYGPTSQVPPDGFEGWFRIIIRNCSRDFLRKERGDSDVQFNEFDYEAEPFRTDLLRLRRDIEILLEKKNKANKEILSMFILQDKSAKEIYMLTEYSVSQIKQAIYRFRKEMKELFEIGQ